MAIAKSLLVVARWPLGGIRTYMRNVYSRLSTDWCVTIVAANSQENEALVADAQEVGAELVVSTGNGKASLLLTLGRLLVKRQFDLIQSQGYISAVLASLANVPFRIPHVVTIHGVLENRLLGGAKGKVRRIATEWAVCSSDIVYCVGDDMMSDVRNNLSRLDGKKPQLVSIPNGIDTRCFAKSFTSQSFRIENDICSDTFLYGFLGRFMPQKGFDTIIDAVEMLNNDPVLPDFKVVAMGNGDYLEWYKKLTKEKQVDRRFLFLPFQRDTQSVYCALNAVVMPSRWEAYGLVAAEALCSGVPLIASNCIGLREVVADTPSLVVPPEDPHSLAEAMGKLMKANYKPAFSDYQSIALDRYDVVHTVERVEKLFCDTARRAN